jgi:Flp pilus assembly protein TadD
MLAERNESAAGRFIMTRLPWIAGACALLVYLATLNRWVSLASLETVTRVSGGLWQPNLLRPLTTLVLWPFRVLPQSWLPMVLNLFAALSGALVLMLLARSVALLVYGLARHEEFRNDAAPTAHASWIPPVLAVALCGLQLSFWEHATSGSDEMIDLLVFAYIIRCLLEFQVRADQSWLSQSAFLYGVGMANHWSLAAYLPVFVLAVGRLKGLRFFEPRFLTRMLFWASAGLAFYLMLPLLNWVSTNDHVGFWAGLKSNLRFQKQMLWAIPQSGYTLLGLSAFVPFLVISFREKLQVGDDSRKDIFLLRTMVFAFLGLFLAAACWMALDPPFSPRGLGLGVPLLSYYYSWALAAGYCTGYFLLNRATSDPRSPFRPGADKAWKLAANLPAVALGMLPVAVAATLLWQNLAEIRLTNGPGLRRLAQALYAGLPEGRSVVMSDDVRELFLVRAEVGAHALIKEPVLLHPFWLASEQYQRFMARTCKSRWPISVQSDGAQAIKPVPLICRFSEHEPVVYLHPSFGYFFEVFADRPAGLIHYLEARPANASVGPRLNEKVTVENEAFWHERWRTSLQSLADYTKDRKDESEPQASSLARRLRLQARRNLTAAFLGDVYARALDYWGVQMQRCGRWPEARTWFERAVELNPQNLSARINLELNRRQREGSEVSATLQSVEKEFPELVSRYRTWQEILSDNGPVDEPIFLLDSARTWFAGGNYHQAAAEFARCAELQPADMRPNFGLAESELALGDFAGALRVIDGMQNSNLTGSDRAELARLRAAALKRGAQVEHGKAVMGLAGER